jgi:hypothetical protein
MDTLQFLVLRFYSAVLTGPLWVAPLPYNASVGLFRYFLFLSLLRIDVLGLVVNNSTTLHWAGWGVGILLRLFSQRLLLGRG